MARRSEDHMSTQSDSDSLIAQINAHGSLIDPHDRDFRPIVFMSSYSLSHLRDVHIRICDVRGGGRNDGYEADVSVFSNGPVLDTDLFIDLFARRHYMRWAEQIFDTRPYVTEKWGKYPKPISYYRFCACGRFTGWNIEVESTAGKPLYITKETRDARYGLRTNRRPGSTGPSRTCRKTPATLRRYRF